jgi:hypothetical protein
VAAGYAKTAIPTGLLAEMQCHIAMIPMQDVAYQELVEAGKSSSPSQSKYDTTAADASLKVANTLRTSEK